MALLLGCDGKLIEGEQGLGKVEDMVNAKSKLSATTTNETTRVKTMRCRPRVFGRFTEQIQCLVRVLRLSDD